jgi:hypothetical protein
MRGFFGLIACLAIAFGCASRESPVRVDSGSPVDAAVDVDVDAGKLPAGAIDALTTNHRNFCKSFQKCFPVQFTNQYGDEEGCVSRRLLLSASILFGAGSLLKTSDIEACARAYGGEYTCDDILRIFFENPIVPADCRLRGELANGSVCAGSDQCKSGHCRYEPTAKCGLCADRVAPGGVCSSHSQCAEGLACQNNKCVAWVERGGACDATKPCHTVDVCGAEGKCVQRLSLASPCDDTLQDCDVNSWCNKLTKTCSALGSYGLAAPCGFRDDGNLGLCNYGLKCKITNSTAYTGACVGAAKVGEPCFRNGPNGSQCEAPLICAGTCVLPSTDTCL